MKVLNGNIYIVGGGDPCLGSDRITGTLSWKNQIELWADTIQKLGIKKIKGKVLADSTKWEKAQAVPSWAWEDLGNYYGAGASALSFHENQYSIFLKPGDKVEEKAAILRIDPPLKSLILQNEVRTGPKGTGDGTCIYGSEFSPIQFIRGTVPLGVDEFSIKGTIPDPATFCADLLSQELNRKNIVIEEESVEPSKKRTRFFTTFSPTIKEIVHWTNQKSNNLYAEHLLKKIGEVTYSEGSTTSGIKAVTDFWSSQKIDLKGFKMADGSGLSRKNLITTQQLVEILLKIKKSTFFPIFFESLPLKNEMMRVKSGSMSLIKGYAGYTNSIAFAILINQCPNDQAIKEKMEALLSKICELDQTPLKERVN
jgi:D-alanyl-D-alanine carboxypeptidase/D-alanyl-D-alanine-endopeptidase (penicillin-binding protein 4)